MSHIAEGEANKFSLCPPLWRARGDISRTHNRVLTPASIKSLKKLIDIIRKGPRPYRPPFIILPVLMDFHNHLFSDTSKEGLGGHFGPIEWSHPTPVAAKALFDKGSINIAHLELYAANLTLCLFLKFVGHQLPKHAIIHCWCDNQVCVFALRPTKMSSTNVRLNGLVRDSLIM
jgi:hypothetical protein